MTKQIWIGGIVLTTALYFLIMHGAPQSTKPAKPEPIPVTAEALLAARPEAEARISKGQQKEFETHLAYALSRLRQDDCIVKRKCLTSIDSLSHADRLHAELQKRGFVCSPLEGNKTRVIQFFVCTW